MKRLALALLAVVSSTAFAPAPFPRATRVARDEISLEACQGTWVVVSNETVQEGRKEKSDWGISHVRIRGSTWTLLDNGREVASYTIAIDGGRKPAHIDWFALGRPNDRKLWLGLVKREGGHVLILYGSGNEETNRPRRFDAATSGILITVKRGG